MSPYVEGRLFLIGRELTSSSYAVVLINTGGEFNFIKTSVVCRHFENIVVIKFFIMFVDNILWDIVHYGSGKMFIDYYRSLLLSLR